MENDWISVALGGLLPEETIRAIIDDYESRKSQSLIDLGLDSMKIMGIIINLETSCDLSIDYESFDLDEIATLERLKSFIDRRVNA